MASATVPGMPGGAATSLTATDTMYVCQGAGTIDRNVTPVVLASYVYGNVTGAVAISGSGAATIAADIPVGYLGSGTSTTSTWLQGNASGPASWQALPVGSSTGFGIVKVDNTTITAASGVISAVSSGGTPASPSGSLQYNNSGAFGAVTGVSSAGTSLVANQNDLLMYGSSANAPVVGTYVGTSAPTASSDSTQGLANGSVGVNTASGHLFALCDNTATAAVWSKQSPAIHPGWPVSTANWYSVWNPVLTINNAGTTTTMVFQPFFVPHRVTVSNVGMGVQAAGASGATFAVLIYSDGINTNNLHRPLTLLGNTGNITCASTGAQSGAFSSNISLEPGVMYWMGRQTSDTANTTRYYGISPSVWNPFYLAGSQTLANLVVSAAQNITISNTYGTWISFTSSSAFSEGGSDFSLAAAFQAYSIP